MKIRRNMIIWAELKNQGRCVQTGIRPCVVISNNTANAHSPVFIVIPGTTQDKKKNFPVHVKITDKDVNGRLYKDTVFMGEQMCTIGESQIINVLGEIKDEGVIRQINEVIKRELALDNVEYCGEDKEKISDE